MIIIGITGTLGAGKGTVVDYLVKNKGFKHFSVREYLSGLVLMDGKEINRTSLVDKGNELRLEHGPGYIAEELFKLAKKSNQNSIIESIRTPGEVDVLKKHDNFTLLAVDAKHRVRYERIYKRASETDKITIEEFKDNENREMTSSDPNKQNLKECIAMADYLITNDGDFDALHNKVEYILRNLS